MIADSTIAVPLSEVFPLGLDSIVIGLRRKMGGSVEPRLSTRRLRSKPAGNVRKDVDNAARYVGIGNHNGDCD